MKKSLVLLFLLGLLFVVVSAESESESEQATSSSSNSEESESDSDASSSSEEDSSDSSSSEEEEDNSSSSSSDEDEDENESSDSDSDDESDSDSDSSSDDESDERRRRRRRRPRRRLCFKWKRDYSLSKISCSGQCKWHCVPSSFDGGRGIYDADNDKDTRDNTWVLNKGILKQTLPEKCIRGPGKGRVRKEGKTQNVGSCCKGQNKDEVEKQHVVGSAC